MNNSKKKNKNQINPEIVREYEEKRRAANLYGEDDEQGIVLFPGYFLGTTASSTDCTGLMQTVPITPAELEAYDSLCSYRQTEAIVPDDE